MWLCNLSTVVWFVYCDVAVCNLWLCDMVCGLGCGLWTVM